MIDPILTWGTAIAGGLATGLAIAAWLIKREFGRMVSVVDRVPDKEWFERVEEKIDRLDPARIDDHFKRLSTVEGKVERQCERLDHLDGKASDHEQRLRVVETRR